MALRFGQCRIEPSVVIGNVVLEPLCCSENALLYFLSVASFGSEGAAHAMSAGNPAQSGGKLITVNIICCFLPERQNENAVEPCAIYFHCTRALSEMTFAGGGSTIERSRAAHSVRASRFSSAYSYKS